MRTRSRLAAVVGLTLLTTAVWLSPAHADAPAIRAAPLAKKSPPRVLAVGDSIMLSASRELTRQVSRAGMQIELDAVVGRRFDAALDAVRSHRRSGPLGDVVVFHAFTNGPFTRAQFESLMREVKGVKRVIVLNAKAPRAWIEPNNALLSKLAARYPNVVVLDWDKLGQAHDEYFYRDGLHLRPTGIRAYSSFISGALRGAKKS